MVGYQYQSDPPNQAIGNRIYHNVITGIARNPVWLENYPDGSNQYTSHITGNVFKNNIFYENPTTDGSLQMLYKEQLNISDNLFHTNIFFRTGSDAVINKSGTGYSVDAIQQADAQFRGNLQMAPSLDADFRPMAGSPAIDAGAALTSVTSESGAGETIIVDDSTFSSTASESQEFPAI